MEDPRKHQAKSTAQLSFTADVLGQGTVDAQTRESNHSEEKLHPFLRHERRFRGNTEMWKWEMELVWPHLGDRLKQRNFAFHQEPGKLSE